MTEKEKIDAAARKAARSLCEPLRKQLERAERTIDVLSQKLEAAELEIVEMKRRITKLHTEMMR